MFRFIENDLIEWKDETDRKPLILSGARQTGKSYVVKEKLAKEFEHFVSIDFERNPELGDIFKDNLDPQRILNRLEIATQKKIIPGSTLLFLDEAQRVPECLTSLRYFYEELPKLHVIAAGSLIQFTLEQISIPVGRVSYRYLTPLSFTEFLTNNGQKSLFEIIQQDYNKGFDNFIHQQAIKALKDYIFVGGMPAIVRSFIENNDYQQVQNMQSDLLRSFEDDILKYTKRNSEYKHTQLVFRKAPQLVGNQFKFSQISRDIKSQYLRHGIELLEKAHILDQVFSTVGIPLAAKARFERYKLLFLDIGLMQRACNLDISAWLQNDYDIINKGAVAEQFIGQQILAHANFRRPKLFYWERAKRNSSAEIDFIINHGSSVIPIEVKSGTSGKLKSLKMFFEENKSINHAIRFSLANTQHEKKLTSYPLYAASAWLNEKR